MRVTIENGLGLVNQVLYFIEPAALIGTALNIIKNYLIIIFPDSLISSFLKTW